MKMIGEQSIKMKNNIIYNYLKSLFNHLSFKKGNIPICAASSDRHVYLLEKKYSVDRKLIRMFWDYTYSRKEAKISKNQLAVNDNRKLGSNGKIIIKDNSYSFFDVQELVRDLYSYYTAYTAINNVDFIIETNLNDIYLPIAKESFYQLIFSIIESKLYFLGSGDRLNITLAIKNHELILVIQDSGFLLSENKIQEYTEKMVANSNIFLINWKKILSILAEYGCHCQLKTEAGNRFQVNLPLNHLINKEFYCHKERCYV